MLDSTISMYNQVSPTALDSVRSLYNQGISKSPTLHLPTPHVPLTVTSSDQSRNSYGNQTVSKLFNSSHVFPHLPASSHTSLIASGIKKAKPKGQTPVVGARGYLRSQDHFPLIFRIPPVVAQDPIVSCVNPMSIQDLTVRTRLVPP